MRKIKLFIENFLVYGLGGIISKLIPLIMVPVITRLLPNSTYYGISDLYNTVVQLGSALAVMGMYDAMYRMFFEKDDENFKKDVCSTALVFTLTTSIAVFAIIIIMRIQIAQWFFGDKKYVYLVYITAIATLVGATNSIVSAPTRMQNKRKVFLITNTVVPLLSYAVAIPMILTSHYVIALPLVGFISILTMELTFAILNHQWFKVKRFNLKILKQMLVIAAPLLPNFLIYWVFNSSDKVMITNLIGVGAAGIYAVGSKLGHVSQLIYTAFAGGWQYFAFSTMKDKDQVKSNSLIFEYLGIISFIANAFMCALSYLLFNILFTGEYVQGYVVAPYLFLAPLLQMLFQVIANQFLIIKKTWPSMLILFGGAAINVILNMVLIPILGIEGAAIATLVGYIISDVIAAIVLTKMKLLIISRRFLLATAVFATFFVLWRIFIRENIVISTFIAVGLSLLFLYLYRNDLKSLITGIKESIHTGINPRLCKGYKVYKGYKRYKGEKNEHTIY